MLAGADRHLLATADVSSSDLGVYTVIGGLMAVGVILLLIATWLFRATKPEMELLAPLERMGDRSWRHLDPAMQRRALDELRPAGARPIARSSQVPDVDDDFDKPIPDIADFDDLRSMQAADARRSAIPAEPVAAGQVAEVSTITDTTNDDTEDAPVPELSADVADVESLPPGGADAVAADDESSDPQPDGVPDAAAVADEPGEGDSDTIR